MKNLTKISSTKLFFFLYGLVLLLGIIWLLLLLYPVFASTKDMMIPPVFIILFAVPFVLPIYIILRYAWQWQVVHQLLEKLPPPQQMSLGLFNSFIILFVIIAVLFLIMAVAMIFSGSIIGILGAGLSFMLPVFIVIPGLIYIPYLSAKILKTVELGREARLGDYIGDMVFFIFPILGIWFLQPRINDQIIEDEV